MIVLTSHDLLCVTESTEVHSCLATNRLYIFTISMTRAEGGKGTAFYCLRDSF